MKKLVTVMLIAFTTVNFSLTAQTASSVLSPVYESYFLLKDALVKGDDNAAQKAAGTLYNNIVAVPMDKLGSSHPTWMNLQPKLSFDSEHIKGTNDIDHQREHFISLSKNIYAMMKAVKYNKTVYWQHCPMYNQQKGGADWLSLDKEIKNPYFGSKMLNCGSITETIE